LPEDDKFGAYGLSKTGVSCLAMMYGLEHPTIWFSSISPGYIDTAIVSGWGGNKKQPSEGTVSIRHCLFSELKANGLFYGSDGLRSPMHQGRDPGTPEYTGEW
jgi:NAD(P)-dependent dehydrogenase (short-subunit alcohol dehydrogenase family)